MEPTTNGTSLLHTAENDAESSNARRRNMTANLTEFTLTLAFLVAAIACSQTVVSNIFSLIYFSAALLAINTVLLVRGVRLWLMLVGTILRLLHVSTVFVYMAYTAFNPYILLATVVSSAFAVVPAAFLLGRAGQRVFALMPLLAGLADIGCWYWLRADRGFDAYNLDFVTIILATVFLCANDFSVL